MESLLESTRGISISLKNRIRALQMQPVDQRTANMRKPQLDLARQKFMDAINKFQAEEKLYRDKYKERMARQFRIGESTRLLSHVLHGFLNTFFMFRNPFLIPHVHDLHSKPKCN